MIISSDDKISTYFQIGTSSVDILYARLSISLQLTVTLPEVEFDCTEVFLVEVQILLELNSARIRKPLSTKH